MVSFFFNYTLLSFILSEQLGVILMDSSKVIKLCLSECHKE